MTKKPFILALALLAAQPAFAGIHADGPLIQSSEEDALYKAAYEMAILQQGDANFSDELLASMSSQIYIAYSEIPEFAELEEASPGFLDALVAAVIPVIVKQTTDSYPALYDNLAKFYAKNLELEDIENATRFFATDSYRVIRESTENNLDMSSILSGAVEDPDGNISSDDLEKLVENSVAQSVGGWDKQVRTDLLKFAFTPTGRKMTSLRAQRNQIEADWANESTPEEDRELEEVLENVILKFAEAE
jgi:hypothetical protein